MSPKLGREPVTSALQASALVTIGHRESTDVMSRLICKDHAVEIMVTTLQRQRSHCLDPLTQWDQHGHFIVRGKVGNQIWRLTVGG